MNYRVFGIALVFMGILLLIAGSVVSIDTIDDTETRVLGAIYGLKTGRQSKAVKELDEEKAAKSRPLYLIGIVLIITGSAFVASSLASRKSKTVTMDNNETLSKNYPTAEAETKKCPACAETIKAEAIKCRFCGELFDPLVVAKELEDRKEKKAHDEEECRKQASIVLCPYCGKDTYKAYIEDGSWGDWCSACKRSVQLEKAAEKEASEQAELRNTKISTSESLCPLCNRETNKKSLEGGKEVDWCQHCQFSVEQIQQRTEAKFRFRSTLVIIALAVSVIFIIVGIASINVTSIKPEANTENENTIDYSKSGTPTIPGSEEYKQNIYINTMAPLVTQMGKALNSCAACLNDYNSGHDPQQIIQKLDEFKSEALIILAQMSAANPPAKIKFPHSRLTEGCKQFIYSINKFRNAIILENEAMLMEANQEAKSGQELIVSAAKELAVIFKSAAK